jgi:hypothetical protein
MQETCMKAGPKWLTLTQKTKGNIFLLAGAIDFPFSERYLLSYKLDTGAYFHGGKTSGV